MEGFGGSVQPPMTEKEVNKMFLNTLKAPYYDRMIGNSNKDFSDVVSAREMIEAVVKQGKIEASEAKKPTFKKKEKHMQWHTKGEPTIPHTNHNQTMVISLIISTVEMSHMETISQAPDPW